jgi:hypothetical protein
MVEISKTYEASNHRMVREQWNKWQEKFFPRDPDSSVYIQQLRQQGIEYKIPLKQILLNKTVIIVEPQWLDRPPLEETRMYIRLARSFGRCNAFCLYRYEQESSACAGLCRVRCGVNN